MKPIGRPKSENTKTSAERQKSYRERLKLSTNKNTLKNQRQLDALQRQIDELQSKLDNVTLLLNITSQDLVKSREDNKKLKGEVMDLEMKLIKVKKP